MYRIKKSWLALLAPVLLSSCSKDVLRGNGAIRTKTVNVAPFTSVETHYDIAAEIRYGSTREVTVSGYENLLPELDLTVDNGVLQLKYSTRYNRIRNGNVVARIQLPVLQKATIHGSEDIRISGFPAGGEWEARIHGSGNIRIGQSVCDKAVLNIHGSGGIFATDLQTREAEANIFGSGRIEISAQQKLKAQIYGSGNVYYWGNPVLETVLQGSGRVIRR